MGLRDDRHSPAVDRRRLDAAPHRHRLLARPKNARRREKTPVAKGVRLRSLHCAGHFQFWRPGQPLLRAPRDAPPSP